MEGKSCYIVGAGERVGVIPVPCPGDMVIAADGGHGWLTALGREVDLVVGDFDSSTLPPLHPNVVCLPKEKDETDTMAALRLGRAQGYRLFHIYGGTGGRFDHTLANLQLLAWLSQRGERGYLYGDGWRATAVTDGSLTFSAGRKGTVSVFAQSDTAKGVFLEGLRYPLSDAVLTNDFALGVSNEFTGAPARVTVGRGTLILVWEEENCESSGNL